MLSLEMMMMLDYIVSCVYVTTSGPANNVGVAVINAFFVISISFNCFEFVN